MDKHAHQLEHLAATGSQHATSSITFDSVINLNDYAGKNCKINIDQSVVERPGQGKGRGEIVSVNENVRMTENRKLVSEHVLNDLTLTDQGDLHLSDRTYVNAAKPMMLTEKRGGQASGDDHASGGEHAKREAGKERDKEGEDELRKLGVSDYSKR